MYKVLRALAGKLVYFQDYILKNKGTMFFILLFLIITLHCFK